MNTTLPSIDPVITEPPTDLASRVANLETLLGRVIDWAAGGRDDLELQTIVTDYEETIGR